MSIRNDLLDNLSFCDIIGNFVEKISRKVIQFVKSYANTMTVTKILTFNRLSFLIFKYKFYKYDTIHQYSFLIKYLLVLDYFIQFYGLLNLF